MKCENQDEGADERIRPIANQDVEDIRQGPAFRARAEDWFVRLHAERSRPGIYRIYCLPPVPNLTANRPWKFLKDIHEEALTNRRVQVRLNEGFRIPFGTRAALIRARFMILRIHNVATGEGRSGLVAWALRKPWRWPYHYIVDVVSAARALLCYSEGVAKCISVHHRTVRCRAPITRTEK